MISSLYLTGCAATSDQTALVVDPNKTQMVIVADNRQNAATGQPQVFYTNQNRGENASATAANPATSQYYGGFVSPGYRSWKQEPKRREAMPGDRALELDYIIRGLADQLALNRDPNASKTPIAVTSITNMDDLQNTNWLGQAISEAFIHELHIRELPVIDFKTTGKIKVTPEGDFVFSREWDQLRSKIPVYRVFTGTMSRNDEGVIVNVRTINMQSLLVESTGRAFIPNRLLVGAHNSLNPAKNDAYIQRHSVPTGVEGRTVEFVK
ncbi:FlgO family outer membrane protein [Motilimonas sp. KMU-193]|uniref:FlgO family outer membrane protein n=1 Tax=Motilimonas sp. KMU-193 TaxID=3388668 RepID=UPI00396B3FEB